MRFARLRWVLARQYCSQIRTNIADSDSTLTILGKSYPKDEYTNVTPHLLTFIDRKLLLRQYHPLNLIKQHICNYFFKNFIGRTGNPIFSVYDNLNPVVNLKENFDSLLIPQTHVSRQKSDTYYINKEYLLRSHTTAHQTELIHMGLDNFLIFGDCYRRDEIDFSHYPVFHQVDGVYTLNKPQIETLIRSEITVFENGKETEEKQNVHTKEASKCIENHLKNTLLSLTQHLYKKNIEYQWVPSLFPFTHPSWELEIKLNDKWIETLGCGIIRHEILKNAGAGDRIGWAFGIGLERLAMHRYNIPDIRVFWSEDSGFTSQFEDADPETEITFKGISKQPQCIQDMSFFLSSEKIFNTNDFNEIVRSIGGDFVEQVKLIDEFFHPKVKQKSRTYRIVYRHMERPLTKTEVNILHTKIATAMIQYYDVTLR